MCIIVVVQWRQRNVQKSVTHVQQQQQQQQQQQILLKIGKYLITLLSHPLIAYKLIEAGGAEDILQNKVCI